MSEYLCYIKCVMFPFNVFLQQHKFLTQKDKMREMANNEYHDTVVTCLKNKLLRN